MRNITILGTALILIMIIGGCKNEDYANSDDNSFDADGILWGTETYPSISSYENLDEKTVNLNDVVNNVMKTKNVKYRLYAVSCTKQEGVFTTDCALPSLSDPQFTFNMDETVKVFKENSWSMMPMFTYCSCNVTDKTRYLSDYTAFISWFVDRYSEDANIRYIELENCPNGGAGSTQLDNKLFPQMQNDVYDSVKSKHPDIFIGTPGFEYWLDEKDGKMEKQIEYFLDSDAKFDFWAFHGYPLVEGTPGSQMQPLPPTCSAVNNKYAGILGILEIRKKMDERGMQDRMIIDTEHTFIGSETLTDSLDEIGAALGVQELLLKRALKSDDKFVLSGINTLKIGARPGPGEHPGDYSWGALNTDGSETKSLKAVAYLISRFNEYKYAGHISGDYNDAEKVWAEKLYASKKELYIIFKPLACQTAGQINLDNKIIPYELKLARKPSSVKLIDMYGKSTDITASQSIKVSASNKPQYVEVTYKEEFDTKTGSYSTAGIADREASQDAGLDGTIPQQEGKCGDGICEETERSKGLCQRDCAGVSPGMCGNGICDDNERVSNNCPKDCQLKDVQGKCGDSICDDLEKTRAELCPKDCNT